MTTRSRLVLWVFCGFVGGFLLLPALVIVPMSFGESRLLQFPPQGFTFHWYQEFFRSPRWLEATWNSLRVAIGTAVMATILGTLASFPLVRARLRGSGVANVLILAPMIVPYVISGLAIYAFFLRLGITDTAIGMMLAHTVLAIPFVVVSVSASLRRFDPAMEAASASLGAGPFRTFFLVTGPIILPGILTGFLFAFIISFDEVVVALFLSGASFQTLPVVMWATVRYEIDPVIAPVSSLLIGLATLILLAMGVLQHIGRRTTGDS